MTLKLIAGPDHVLPRSFLPWSTELLFSTDHSPTGLTHLGLTARWRSLKDTALLFSSFHVQD